MTYIKFPAQFLENNSHPASDNHNNQTLIFTLAGIKFSRKYNMEKYTNRNSQTDIPVTLYPAPNFPIIISSVVCNTILPKFSSDFSQGKVHWIINDSASSGCFCQIFLIWGSLAKGGTVIKVNRTGALLVQFQLELLLNLVKLQLCFWLSSFLSFQECKHSAISSSLFCLSPQGLIELYVFP